MVAAAVAKGAGAAPVSAATVVPVVVPDAGFVVAVVAVVAKGGGAAPVSAATVVPVVVTDAGFVVVVVATTGEFVVIVIIEGKRPALAFMVVDVIMLAGATAIAAIAATAVIIVDCPTVSVPLA